MFYYLESHKGFNCPTYEQRSPQCYTWRPARCPCRSVSTQWWRGDRRSPRTPGWLSFLCSDRSCGSAVALPVKLNDQNGYFWVHFIPFERLWVFYPPKNELRVWKILTTHMHVDWWCITKCGQTYSRGQLTFHVVGGVLLRVVRHRTTHIPCSWWCVIKGGLTEDIYSM